MSAKSEKQFFRPDVRRDVDEEIASHLEMRARELVERGVLPGEARDAAAKRFGNVASIARECRAIDEAWYREQRRANMWMDLRQDIAYALRLLARSPAFSVVAVLTLAVGIGATTAIFSLANWALLRPVPGVERPHELQQVWTGTRRGSTGFSPGWLSYPNLMDITPRLQTIRLAGEKGSGVSIGRGSEGARPVPTSYVTPSYFEVLGVRMRAGRPFSPAEDTPGNGARVMVVSERFARLTFGTPEAALGQTLLANGVPMTVIGVTGRNFAGIERMSTVDAWMPGATYPEINHMPALRYDDRQMGGYYELIARLTPGGTWAQADAELKSMAAWLVAQYPKENAKFADRTAFHIMGEIGSNPLGLHDLTRMTLLMLGVSLLVLLVACSNVASLLTMRGVGRGSEVAVRKALGAGRFRLLRQHVTEGTLLWMFGGAVAVLVVWWGLRSADGAGLLGLRGGIADGVPVDWRVVAFAALLSLLVGLLFSVAPAVRALRVEAAEMLRQGNASATPRSLRVGTTLTVVQLALSLTLVVGALLLTVTMRRLSSVELGFNPDGVYTFYVRPSVVGYTAPRASAYRDEFARQLALVPGVERVAVASRAPFSGVSTGLRVRPFGTTGAPVEAEITELTTTSYFETVGIPLRSGRLFSQEDLGSGISAPRQVVIVSESIGRQLFGGASPVGRAIEFRTMNDAGKRFEIIGVVGDARYNSLTEEMAPMIYEPASPEAAARGFTFLVRASPGADVGGAATRIAAALDPAMPIAVATSLKDGVARSRAPWTVLARLMTALATVAGLLAGIGLYGVVAFGVAARRREFGIRLALGAAPARVMALVLRRTAIIAAFGLALGFGGAFALARVLSSRLFGVTPFDPLVWSIAALIFVLLAAVASWIPARRTVSIDVTRSLRSL